jgi:hypothetical protein
VAMMAENSLSARSSRELLVVQSVSALTCPVNSYLRILAVFILSSRISRLVQFKIMVCKSVHPHTFR